MLPGRRRAPVTAPRAPAQVPCTAVVMRASSRTRTPTRVSPIPVALLLIVLGLAALVWLIPAAPMTGDGQYYIQFVRNNLQHGASSWHERRLLGPVYGRGMPLE